MASHGRTLETGASPERVWRLWSDVSTWPSWNPDVLSVAIEGPFVSGAHGTMTTKAGGTHAITLSDVAPPARPLPLRVPGAADWRRRVHDQPVDQHPRPAGGALLGDDGSAHR